MCEADGPIDKLLSEARWMVRKTAGNRIELPKKGESSIVAATVSVRELNGMLYRKGSKPVSIEEMDAAISEGASRGVIRTNDSQRVGRPIRKRFCPPSGRLL